MLPLISLFISFKVQFLSRFSAMIACSQDLGACTLVPAFTFELRKLCQLGLYWLDLLKFSREIEFRYMYILCFEKLIIFALAICNCHL